MTLPLYERHLLLLALCRNLYSFAVTFALAPVALIPGAIGAHIHPKPVFFAIAVVTLVVVAVGPCVLALAMGHSVLEVALIPKSAVTYVYVLVW